MLFKGSMLLLALSAPGVLFAQTAPAAQQPANVAPAQAAARPSQILQPTIEIVKGALGSVDLNKWKASNAVKSEADSNLHSVQRDVENTLPSLLAAADAAPDSPAKTIPVFRNVDALYDVILRIDAAARLSAPKDQLSAVDQALSSVSDARRTLGDQLQAAAEAQESRIARLQAQLKAVPPPAPPPAPVTCTPPPTTSKKRRGSASKPKSTTPQSSTTQSH